MTDAYDEPAGVAARGTVLVAAGRGETVEVYGRFGRRIAADGYRVRVLPDVAGDPDVSRARAVLFLERLRLGPTLPVIARVVRR
jgi:hypothetical protein